MAQTHNGLLSDTVNKYNVCLSIESPEGVVHLYKLYLFDLEKGNQFPTITHPTVLKSLRILSKI